MCGRYTVTKKKSEIEETFDVKGDLDFIENYNVAPSTYMPVITNIYPQKMHLLKWGLVPYWTKNSTISNNLINARSETVFEKPSFKNPIRKKRCCIIADGYYEWKKENGRKQPYYIHLEHNKLFLFAGIWDSWKSEDNKQINSFSILTKEAYGNIANVHHRVPIVLDNKDDWLGDINKNQINYIIKKNKVDFQFHAISKDVNKPENNYRDLINYI